jgi:hypothetical protein
MLSLEDERQITAVLLRYATGIDNRDWALFRTCFSDDFVADYPGFGAWRGPDEITEFMIKAHLERGITLHRCSNMVITGEGSRAAARTYVDAWLPAKEPGGSGRQAIGFYDDEFVRTADGWKISLRRFTSAKGG